MEIPKREALKMIEDELKGLADTVPAADWSRLNLDQMIMGIIVEPSGKEKVHIKFLAIAGGCGPGFTVDRSLAVQLHDLLGKFLETGTRQEV